MSIDVVYYLLCSRTSFMWNEQESVLLPNISVKSIVAFVINWDIILLGIFMEKRIISTASFGKSGYFPN